jgi:NAD(P)H-dependent flavin oxidoreductase YrpB (nitropropane dioxygenase family)
MHILQTLLCRLLAIELPIVQAPIGSATCPELAAAVCEAGGLGMLALSWKAEDEVRQMIRETKILTKRPFGVNLVLEWDQHERLRFCLEEGVEVFSFFGANPLRTFKKRIQPVRWRFIPWGPPPKLVALPHAAQTLS